MSLLKLRYGVAALGAMLGVALLLIPVLAEAARNCDDNAIVWCGATTKGELNSKIANGDGNTIGRTNDLKTVFESHGITADDINQTVDGTVNKKGEVMVDGKIVATGAWSYGRKFIDGSVAEGNLWIRPTSASFVSDNLAAWVNIQNGQFKWAILQACGNLVAATPVATTVTAQSSIECTALTASTVSGTVPVTVNFTAEVKNVNTTVQSYIFDFGDGSSQESSNQNATHTYNRAGSFTASLRIKSSSGTTSVQTICQKTIIVTAPPSAVIIPTAIITPPPVPIAVTTPRTGAGGIAGVMGGGFISYAYAHYKRSKRSLSKALKR